MTMPFTKPSKAPSELSAQWNDRLAMKFMNYALLVLILILILVVIL